MSELRSQTFEKVNIPWFGVRAFARKCALELADTKRNLETKTEQLNRLTAMGSELVAEVKKLRSQHEMLKQQLSEYGYLTASELEIKKNDLEHSIAELMTAMSRLHQQHEQQYNEQAIKLEHNKRTSLIELAEIETQREKAHQALVNTDELMLLQEVGVYSYRHPLTNSIAYQGALAQIEDQIKVMVKKDGGAILATTNWLVNNSATEGRKMVRDFSKLMLRSYNAEADNLIRSMKPYKLDSALDRLNKVTDTIVRLGKTMSIQIAPSYHALRIRELQLTADFLQKQAEEKEMERAARERLREERKAQQEIERERERLAKELQHYSNVLSSLLENGDEAAAERIRIQISDVNKAIEDVDYRAANIRAGYVYVVSNIGSFGDKMIKIGMTRRLDPMDRIRELSDASVPFNFDVHAMFFSNDAVTIESEMHAKFAATRVNSVNRRREFFRSTPHEAKKYLSELTGELLEFNEIAEALEYRQSLTLQAG